MGNKITFLKINTTKTAGLLFITFLIMNLNLQTHADCPKLCECKWKNGKESVFCTNSDLKIVPHNLDPSTQVLDLGGNEITKLQHDAFIKVGLVNLQKVFLQRCKVKLIDRYAFRKIKNLIELDLSYNFLNFIPSQIFNSIGELRELKLNGNPIQKITNDAFANLPQLMRLELSNCKINFIDRYSFKGIEHTLEWLKLDGNKIIDFQTPATITSLENLSGIELHKNLWNCTCKIKPIAKYLALYKISQTIPAVCRYPLRLLNRSWNRLTLDEFACEPIIKTNLPKLNHPHAEHDNNKLIIEYEMSNITLTCYFNNFIDRTNIKWYINEKFVNINNYSNLIKNDNKYNFIFANNLTKLTINNLDQNDNGPYSCYIENKAGNAKAIFNLEVLYKQTIFNYINLHKIIIFTICFTVLFIIILIAIIINVILFRRKNKIGNKNYNGKRAVGIRATIPSNMTINGVQQRNVKYDINKVYHDYEKLDHFKIPSNTKNLMKNSISTTILPTNCSNNNGNMNATYHYQNTDEFSLAHYYQYKYIPTYDQSNDNEEESGNETTDITSYNENSNIIQNNVEHLECTVNKSSKKNSISFSNCKIKRLCRNELSFPDNQKKLKNCIKRIKTAKMSSNDHHVVNEYDDIFGSCNITPNVYPASQNEPLKGCKPKFAQHIMTQKILDSSDCSLFSTTSSEKPYIPDLLDVSKDVCYEKLYTSYSTLPITKTTFNYFTNKSNHNNETSLSSSRCDANTLNVHGKLSKSKRRHYRRYSVDSSLSYIQPTSSNVSLSSSSSSVVIPQNSSQCKTGRKSKSQLNLLSPNISCNESSTFSDLNFNKLIKFERKPSKVTKIPLTATPLLDFSYFPLNNQTDLNTKYQQANTESKLLYEHHQTSQLEFFLQEYRLLQNELKTIGGLYSTPKPLQIGVKDKTKYMDVEIGQSAQFADPLMFNDVWYSSNQPPEHTTGLSPTTSPAFEMLNKAIVSRSFLLSSQNTATIPSSEALANTTNNLKKKTLVNWNKSPDPPPYWMHRNAMLKQLNNNGKNKELQNNTNCESKTINR